MEGGVDSDSAIQDNLQDTVQDSELGKTGKHSWLHVFFLIFFLFCFVLFCFSCLWAIERLHASFCHGNSGHLGAQSQ